jgi:hypothetical protein
VVVKGPDRHAGSIACAPERDSRKPAIGHPLVSARPTGQPFEIGLKLGFIDLGEALSRASIPAQRSKRQGIFSPLLKAPRGRRARAGLRCAV